MGSNGLTFARHDVFGHYLATKYPESFDGSVPADLVYSGNYKLTDNVKDSPVDAGKLVLSPTRTYAPVVKKVLDEMRSDIHGMFSQPELRTSISDQIEVQHMKFSHGFETVETRQLEEINSKVTLYRYQKTGTELLSVENDDENKEAT